MQEVASAMDIAMDQSQEGKSKLEAMRDSSRRFDAGLPSGLDEAALLMCALSFGPLNKNDLARALKQVGMTMPDGSPVTIQKAAECIQHLRKKGYLTARDYEPPVCPPEVRIAQIDAARAKGWLFRFAKALQQAVPGQMTPNAWEYKWSGRRFVSLSHACRDVFLALENDDQDELKRLAGLCSKDMETRSLTDVLLLDLHRPVSAGPHRASARPVLGHRAHGRHVPAHVLPDAGSSRLSRTCGPGFWPTVTAWTSPSWSNVSRSWPSGTSSPAISPGRRPFWRRSRTWTRLWFEA